MSQLRFFCLTVIVLELASVSLAFSQSPERHPLVETCPQTPSSWTHSEQISVNTLSGKLAIEFYWNATRRPYPLLYPDILKDRLKSISYRFQTIAPSVSFPKKIEILIFDAFENSHLKFSGFFCPNLQEKEIAKFLVNKNFVESFTIFTPKLTHELAHYYTWKTEKDFDPWFEEGLAYNLELKASGSQINQATYDHISLTPWFSLNSTQPSGVSKESWLSNFYTHSELFIQYILNHCDEGLFEIALHSTSQNARSIVSKICNRPFEDVFSDFQIRKYINRSDYFQRDDLVDRYRLTRHELLPSLEVASLSPSSLSASIIESHRVNEFFQKSNCRVYWIPDDNFRTPIEVLRHTGDTVMPGRSIPLVVCF